MAVQSQIPAQFFAANGVTTVFPFTFKVNSPGDIKVILATAAGVETPVDPSAYTVALTATGGSVTFGVAPADLLIVFVRSNAAFVQDSDIKGQNGYVPTENERAIDKIAILLKQLKYDVDRSIKTPDSDDPATFGMKLASRLARKNKVIGFDTDGKLTLLDSSSLGGGGGITPACIEAYLTESTVFAAGTRFGIPFAHVRYSEGMSLCDADGWFDIPLDGVYALMIHAYCTGTGAEKAICWQKQIPATGAHAADRWISIQNTLNGAAGDGAFLGNTTVPVKAGDRIRVEIQSDQIITLLFNAPDAVNDPTRPDQQYLYPRCSITRIANLPANYVDPISTYLT